MKQPSTFILKMAIILIGVAMLALCVLGLPQVIGAFQIGGYDPILLGLYVPAIPFFIALYQALKILSYVDAKRAFSDETVRSFNIIKLCALIITGLFTAGLPYIFYIADKDDAPGVVAITLIIIFLSFVIGIFASVMQKLLQNVVEIKSENDLTV